MFSVSPSGVPNYTDIPLLGFTVYRLHTIELLRISGCEIPRLMPEEFYFFGHCHILIRLFCTQMFQFRAHNHHLFPRQSTTLGY